MSNIKLTEDIVCTLTAHACEARTRLVAVGVCAVATSRPYTGCSIFERVIA